MANKRRGPNRPLIDAVGYLNDRVAIMEDMLDLMHLGSHLIHGQATAMHLVVKHHGLSAENMRHGRGFPSTFAREHTPMIILYNHHEAHWSIVYLHPDPWRMYHYDSMSDGPFYVDRATEVIEFARALLDLPAAAVLSAVVSAPLDGYAPDVSHLPQCSSVGVPVQDSSFECGAHALLFCHLLLRQRGPLDAATLKLATSQSATRQLELMIQILHMCIPPPPID